MTTIPRTQSCEPHFQAQSHLRWDARAAFFGQWRLGLFAFLTAACGDGTQGVPLQGHEAGAPSVSSTALAGSIAKGGAGTQSSLVANGGDATGEVTMGGATAVGTAGGGATVHSSVAGGSSSVGVGGTAPSGGTGNGSAGASSGAACPTNAPAAGEPCQTNSVCSYEDNITRCARTARARCINAKWAVELPMDCPQPTNSETNCDVRGTWAIDYSMSSTELMGIPSPNRYVLTRDTTGQYYVAPPPQTSYAFTSWSFASFKNCEVSASSHFDTVIPPSDGSNCGLVTSSCTLKLAFVGKSASGTVACSGNRPGCTSSLISWVRDATATRIEQ
jgi:hypothetical protein